MFRIQHTEYLFGLMALPLLGALFYLLIQWKKQAAARMGDPLLVEQLVKNFSPRRFLIKFLLALLAFAAIVLGAGNLQKPGAMENVRRSGQGLGINLGIADAQHRGHGWSGRWSADPSGERDNRRHRGERGRRRR